MYIFIRIKSDTLKNSDKLPFPGYGFALVWLGMKDATYACAHRRKNFDVRETGRHIIAGYFYPQNLL